MKQSFKIFIILTILAPGAGASGQINFREGRIITLQNDTVYGLIKDCGSIRGSRVCLFKENRRSKTVEYHPGYIQSYQITGDKYYSSQQFFFNGELATVFADVLLEGEISLYYFRKNKKLSYYVEKKDGTRIGLINAELNLQRNSEYGDIGDSNIVAATLPVFRDSLKHLFADDSEIQDQLKNVEYNHKSLIGITRAYLNENCEGDDCITYERDLRRTRDRFGVFSGVQLSQIHYMESATYSAPAATVPLGIFYNIPLTLINERFSFQIEMIYRRLKYDQFYNMPPESTDRIINSNVLGIPLMFNYKFSVRRFSPTVGAGNEFGYVFNTDTRYTAISPIPGEDYEIKDGFVFRTQKRAWFADVGMSYELSQRLSLFSTIRFQRHLNKAIDNKYQNNFIYKNAEGEEYVTYSASLHVGLKF